MRGHLDAYEEEEKKANEKRGQEQGMFSEDDGKARKEAKQKERERITKKGAERTQTFRKMQRKYSGSHIVADKSAWRLLSPTSSSVQKQGFN
jgi:hypothetical protein